MNSKIFFIFILLNVSKSVLNCDQAWNGGGTGAWYRVDSLCKYSFISTKLNNCLPRIIIPSNVTSFDDGFFVSLGIYNRLNGVSIDIGLTYDYNKDKWFSYGNDRLGWKSGSISVDSKLNPCINVSLSVNNNQIIYIIKNSNGTIKLGEDIYYSSQIDPQLNLTKNNSNYGFYRFDSIAQIKESLNTSSQLIHAQTSNWTFEFFSSGLIVPANESYIASNVHGFSPGPCCTVNEIKTITVFEQIKWNQSDISIRYIPLDSSVSVES